jgi:hypothetical protein
MITSALGSDPIPPRPDTSSAASSLPPLGAKSVRTKFKGLSTGIGAETAARERQAPLH